jgi:cysteinyl-tRNA synthetase
MRLYNSLSRTIEDFEPLGQALGKPSNKVGMYTCGPTVYSFVSVGNWRTYLLGDLLVRALTHFDYEVDYVMNVTDVGHLTGDNLGDADTGEDRLEKAAEVEGKDAWELAQFYTDDFLQGYEQLHLTKPRVFVKATEHIKEQIAMVETIMNKGLAYQITDGIYFDTQAFEAGGNTYGELSTLGQIKEGARVEPNPEKKDPRDFALWKFSPAGVMRQMEWDSPWGKGFPGWHIECSAMSCAYLGEQFDIHVGGEDLRSTHHPNEIAQAEAATGKKPFVKYWIHGAFLLVDGGRMGKSLGNAYTLEDLKEKGFEPMDLRYFFLTGHYRKQLNFTFESLAAARSARLSLVEAVVRFAGDQGEARLTLSNDKLSKVDAIRSGFSQALADDLNMPKALAVVWELVKSNIPSRDKYELLVEFDEVLGLGLTQSVEREVVIPDEVRELIIEREGARRSGNYELADRLRNQIFELGYEILDEATGYRVKKRG